MANRKGFFKKGFAAGQSLEGFEAGQSLEGFAAGRSFEGFEAKQGPEAFRASRALGAKTEGRSAAGVIGAAMLALLMGLPSVSQAARRGVLICDEPEAAYNKARAYPDNPDYWVERGMCLIAEGNDAQGLEELRMASENNIPYAAFLRALYRETKGTFGKSDYFQPDLTPAIRSYERAWMLAMNINYHDEENLMRKLAEEGELIILITGYSLPVLHFYRYFRGAAGHHRTLLSKSPTNTKKKFASFYPMERNITLQSLSEMKGRAHRCRSLQYDAELWERPVYEHFTGLCDILYEAAEAAIPLERERLNAAKQCEDILKCPEYEELSNRLISWFDETEKILIEKERNSGIASG